MSATNSQCQTFEARHSPKTFDDLVFADHRVERTLREYATRQNYDNLVLHGPFGTAKSSTARLLVQACVEATGNPLAHIAVGKGTDFNGNLAKIESEINLAHMVNGLDPTPYCVINEADRINTATQHDLRDFLDNLKLGKLILTTNYLDKIDGGVLSRCDTVEMLHPSPQQWLPRAKAILAAEGISLSDSAVLGVLAGSHSAREVMRALHKIVVRSTQNHGSASPNNVPVAVPLAAPPLSLVPGNVFISISTVPTGNAQLFSILPGSSAHLSP